MQIVRCFEDKPLLEYHRKGAEVFGGTGVWSGESLNQAALQSPLRLHGQRVVRVRMYPVSAPDASGSANFLANLCIN